MKHKNWINVLIMVGLLVSKDVLRTGAPRPAYAETDPVTIWYVKNGASGGCSSWTDACSLQYALNNVVSGTELWLAADENEYLPYTLRDQSIELINGVAIYCGFDGDENSRDQRDADPATNNTVLSGNVGRDDIDDNNLYHVVTASGTDNTAILDGFYHYRGKCHLNYISVLSGWGDVQ